MNIKKRYEIVDKIMPDSAKKLVTNLKPSVTYKGNEVQLVEEYFFKGEKKTRLLVKNLETGHTTRRQIKETKKEKIPFMENQTLDNLSPNGKWAVYSKDYNLYLKNVKSGETTQITTDGNIDYAYGQGFSKGAFRSYYLEQNTPTSCWFMPDSKLAMIDILVSKNVGTLTVTQVFNNKSTTEPMHPRDLVYRDYFPFEADSEVSHRLGILNVQTKELKLLDMVLDPYFSARRNCRLDKDGKGFIFVLGDKYNQSKTLFHCDFDTLTAVELGKETTDTFFHEWTGVGDVYNGFGFGIHPLENGKEAIWASKKEDLNSLYIYDFEKKDFTRKITDGSYNIASIKYVDEANGIIYFIATNLDTMSDPYYPALCSICMDGTGFKNYTPEDAWHDITFNMATRSYVDTYSTIETKPVTVLGKLDCDQKEVLLEANISKLLKAGYIMPKRVKVTLDDGMTLYGCIVLPRDYDENKKYPIVEHCYGGPQTINTPKKFTAWGDIAGREAFGGIISFANLGFIGVIIDGRGTPDRGKKMHDYSYQNLHGLDGLCDHEPALRKLALEYKGMDLTRVGIWGNSAGGYMSTRALLEYPDFYKVAVSSAGDHDNQIYNASWAFRYHGKFDKETYLAQDSAQLVDNFKGHLLLCHGLLDDNVHPSQTFRMIQYFNMANKDVDLMVLPDTDHNCPGNIYFLRRRFDYFVKHLMGIEPPKEFKFKDQRS